MSHGQGQSTQNSRAGSPNSCPSSLYATIFQGRPVFTQPFFTQPFFAQPFFAQPFSCQACLCQSCHRAWLKPQRKRRSHPKMQPGSHLTRQIRRKLRGQRRKRFRSLCKGLLGKEMQGSLPPRQGQDLCPRLTDPENPEQRQPEQKQPGPEHPDKTHPGKLPDKTHPGKQPDKKHQDRTQQDKMQPACIFHPLRTLRQALSTQAP